VFLARQFEDPLVILLLWMATIVLALSLFGDEEKLTVAYVETLSIYAGLLFAALISAGCDYVKESQILLLADEINNQEVTVYRGSYGNSMSIPIRELVVGDVVDVKQGDRVPADCLLLDEMNITVDESLYFGRSGAEDHHRCAKETSAQYGPGQKDTFD
jgi:magnesium-transporting ATPase (P-type)